MSFYSEASLAYVASAGAGKDGKAYSMKPVDGTGDFTFSRGSNLAATRVGPTGLIEKGRENLFLQSNQFDTTPWTNTSIGFTSGQTGYDGSSDAWLIERVDVNAHIRQTPPLGNVLTISIYVKANTLNWVRIRTSSVQNAYFDLSTGSIGTTQNIIDATITDVGNGWYRCTATAIGYDRFFVYPAVNDQDVSGTTGSIYVQDAQCELGLAATDYIESGATTGKAGLLEDEPRFDYSGSATCPSLLLEPSRTQYIPYTEYLEGLNGDAGLNFNYNNATSPEGLTNAVQVVSSNTSQSYVGYFNSPTTAGDNTFSVFAKYDSCQYICIRILSFTGGDDGYYWFDIQNGTKGSKSGSTITYDVEDYGNGWYRCYLVHNVDAGDLTGAARIYLSNSDSSLTSALNQAAHLYGFQWEAGSYSTSYIPNHSGGTITRGADEISKLTGVGVTGDKFSIFLEFDLSDTPLVTNLGTYFQTFDSSNNSQQEFRFFNWAGEQVLVPYFRQDAAYAFGNGSNAVRFDGKILFRSDGGGGYTMFFGFNGSSTKEVRTGLTAYTLNKIDFISQPKTNLKQLLIFNEALSDADCITLTT